MRVRYTYSSRKTGRARAGKNMRKQRPKYPDLLDKIIQNSDIILEILEARFANETQNEKIEEEIKKKSKKIIYVLNKADIADIKKIKKTNLKKLYPYVFTSCTERKGIKELRDRIKIEAKKIEFPLEANKISVGVIGYPNTGKSSIINLLVGKSIAGTGAEAGFTKGIQKIKLTPEIVLLDSPGVIPREEYSNIEQKLIASHTKLGARSYSQVKEPDIVVANLMQEFPGVFEKFYDIDAKGNSEILIEELGKQKGFMKKGNLVDEDKTARHVLKELQAGKIQV
ncbi:MAG: GTPase [Nanoarchaeota archaeon]